MHSNSGQAPFYGGDGGGGGGGITTSTNLRPYVNPDAIPGVTVVLYVRTTGDDTTGVPGDPLLPFATVEGALRQIAWAPLLGGYTPSYEIDIGPGSFNLPAALPGWAGVVSVVTDVTVSLTRNVSAVVQNTPNGGNGVTLDGAAIAGGALRGEIVEFLTAGLVPICYGVIYENVGNTIYFETDSTAINEAIPITSVVRVLAQNTVFTAATGGTVFSGSDIVGAFSWTGGDFSAVALEFQGGFSAQFFRAKFYSVYVSDTLQIVWTTCAFSGVGGGIGVKSGGNAWVEAGTSFMDGNYGIYAEGGFVLMGTAVSFARLTASAITGIGLVDVSPYATNTAIARVVDCPYVLTANDSTEYRLALGGAYYLPRCVSTTGLTGVTVQAVKATNGAQVKLGASSNIVIGANTNPVSADDGATICSTASDGTRIVGGSPTPGGAGFSTQYVTTNAQTWDGISRTVVFTTATMGAAVFNLPAIALGVGVTDSCIVKLINSDGVAAVVVTPSGVEKIDNVAAAFNLGAAGVTAAMDLVVQKATNNWMVS